MDEVSPTEDITCAECGRPLDEGLTAEAAGWRFYPAGAKNQHPFCPECAEREFGAPV